MPSVGMSLAVIQCAGGYRAADARATATGNNAAAPKDYGCPGVRNGAACRQPDSGKHAVIVVVIAPTAAIGQDRAHDWDEMRYPIITLRSSDSLPHMNAIA